MGTKVGFTPEDVSARSMQAGGAMALLMAPVDMDTIRFVGSQPTQANTDSAATCTAATFVSLFFTRQKNCVKGESIGNVAT